MTDITDMVHSSSRATSKVRSWLPVACTVLLLAGICFDRAVIQRPGIDAAPYLAKVHSAEDAVPWIYGRWIGTEAPVPTAAVAMLKPNVIISRRYEQMGTGDRGTLMLVQCRDARDILGHYPPICYVGQGWTLGPSEPREWQVDELQIHATRYQFTTPQHNRVIIDNFMVLPNGLTVLNMDGVEQVAQDRRQKFFGAAQVQVLSDADMPESSRTEMFKEFVRILRPVLVEIMRPIERKD